MLQEAIIIFVCEHGAAKSIIAAAYFNKVAGEMGLALRATARGTFPDPELSVKTLTGLAKDGLAPTEPAPQKLSHQEMETAQQVIAFCELSNEFQLKNNIERWEDVPPVSENYERARDVIVAHIRRLVNSL
jgi:arsenate reductase (thioredoxin)